MAGRRRYGKCATVLEQRRFGEVWISYPEAIGSTTGSESRTSIISYSFFRSRLHRSKAVGIFQCPAPLAPARRRRPLLTHNVRHGICRDATRASPHRQLAEL